MRWHVAPLLSVGALVLSAAASADEKTAAQTICGRPADMVQIVISMLEPSVESVWRGGKIHVKRDTSDGSLWGFSLPNTTVHPAVFCRRPVSRDGREAIETGMVCAADEKACASFAEQVTDRFEKIETTRQ